MEHEILDAFATTLIDIVANSNIPTMPIKMPLRTFVPPDSGKYIELVQIKNNDDDAYWDASKILQGIFRVILHWPNNDAGAIDPEKFLETMIAMKIPKGSILRSGTTAATIYQNPKAEGMIDQPQDILFPLSFYYRSFSVAD